MPHCARTPQAAVNIGVTKASYTWKKVAMLSFMAVRVPRRCQVALHVTGGTSLTHCLFSQQQGCQIGLGALLMTVVGGGSPGVGAANPGLGKWLNGAIGLPVGLSMVILTGGELFTGNVFFMLAALLSNKVSPRALAINWFVSFWGNFLGSLFVAAMAYSAGTTAVQPWLGTTLNVAAYKASLPLSVAFTRGILCNWLVCTAVWIATAAQSPAGKFLGIWLLVSSFVAMGFEHSIANMFLIPLGMLNGASVSIAQFLTQNLVPVTLGNIVGGGLIIAAGYFYAYGERSEGTPAN
jgi:hypothetical protein